MTKPRPFAIALVLILGACEPVTLLDLDDVTAAQVQMQAMVAACREAPCADRPVLVARDLSPELHQALATALPNEVRYYDDLFAEALLVDGLYLDGATAVVPSAPYELGENAIAIDVWTHRGPLHGLGKTYLFLWDGATWTETTADEVGVTVSTAVS